MNNVYFLERLNNFPPDLVVFLSFTAGWSLHQIYYGRPLGLAVPIKWTLIGYLIIGVGSGAITILRYSQFYPLVGDRFQSLTVNLLDESNHEAILWAFQSLLTFIAGPAILWAVFNLIEHRRHVIQILLALALGMVVPIALGIAQSLGWEFLMTERGIRDHRVNATFVDSNALACFFMLALPAIASLIFLLRQFWNRIAIVLLVICGFYVLICSGSRTGLLDIVIVIITGIFLFLTHLLRAPLRGRIRIGKVVIVMAVFLMAIGLVEVLSARYGRSVLGARMERTIQAAREKGFINMVEASNRWPMWKRAGKIISTFPFTGIGLGAYHTEIPNFMKWTPYDTFVRDSACNYYLQLYAEMGPIGLFFGILILVVILYYTFRLALRHSLHPPELVLGCILCADLFAMMLMFVTGRAYPVCRCPDALLDDYRDCLRGVAQ